MAKALLGHVGLGADLRTLAEVRGLRDRVRELESEVANLRAANAELLHSVAVERDLIALSVHEPALT